MNLDSETKIRAIEAMTWGADRLAEERIDNCRADADLLLAKILKFSRDRLYLERDRMLSAEEWEEYKGLIERRAGHEPLQYLLKRQEFMGLEFYVDGRVLIPRAETELLVEKILELKSKVKKQEPAVLDLCTGSGAIAIAINYYWPETKVTGVDISMEALEVAEFNARTLGVEIDFRQGDFLAEVKGEQWDFIVTNPPYVSEEEYQEVQPEIYREPKIAFLGGVDGLDFYRELALKGRASLNDEGIILMEIGWRQGLKICKLFDDAGFKTTVFQDLAGRDRLVMAI